MRILFLAPEPYVDWEQESFNHDVRLPVLASGVASAHLDICYQRLLRQLGRAQMEARVLEAFAEFTPDLVIYGVTWPGECLGTWVLRRMQDRGAVVFTQTFDLQNGPPAHEIEQFFSSTYFGVSDSITHTFAYRSLLGLGVGPRDVLFTAGNNCFRDLVKEPTAQRDLDVLLLGSLEGHRVAFLSELRERLHPHGIRVDKAGGLVDSTAATPESGLSDAWIPWDRYAGLLQRTKIALCSQTQPGRCQLKGKVFHYLAAGALCLTDGNPEVAALVPPDCLVAYAGAQDCAETIRWLLAHPDECHRIAERGTRWFRATFDPRRYWRDACQAMVDATALPPDPPLRSGPGMPGPLGEDARRAYRARALRVACNQPETSVDQAAAAIQAGVPAVAVAQLLRLAGEMPHSTALLNRLGEAWYSIGDPGRAREIFEFVTHRSPGFALARSNLAVLRADAGDLAGALTLADQAHVLAPDDSTIVANSEALRCALGGTSSVAPGHRVHDSHTTASRPPSRRFLVSAIVPVRVGGSLLETLTDLRAQTIADRLEILLWEQDAAESPARGLTASLDRARGQYAIVVDPEDRHRPEALEVLAAALAARPESAVSYADASLLTAVRSGSSGAVNLGALRHPPFSLRQTLVFGGLGPLVMWRTDLARDHTSATTTNSANVRAAVLDCTLQLAQHHGAIHHAAVLAWCGARDERSPGAEAGGQSEEEILRTHRNRVPLVEVYPGLRERFRNDPRARAAALVDFAIAMALAPCADLAAAKTRLLEASALFPLQPTILTDLALIDCLTGDTAPGLAALNELAEHGIESAASNREAIRAGRPATLVAIPHPVVDELPALRNPRTSVAPLVAPDPARAFPAWHPGLAGERLPGMSVA